MIRSLRRGLQLAMFSNKKIPKPMDPTVAESFGTKISDDVAKILIDPRGFMTEEEKLMEATNTTEKVDAKKQEDVVASTEASGPIKP